MLIDNFMQCINLTTEGVFNLIFCSSLFLKGAINTHYSTSTPVMLSQNAEKVAHNLTGSASHGQVSN